MVVTEFPENGNQRRQKINKRTDNLFQEHSKRNNEFLISPFRNFFSITDPLGSWSCSPREGFPRIHSACTPLPLNRRNSQLPYERPSNNRVLFLDEIKLLLFSNKAFRCTIRWPVSAGLSSICLDKRLAAEGSAERAIFHVFFQNSSP
jgi:hypothetical protein